MRAKINELTRFDARLPKDQKEFFEKAAYLGGFRSLTEFVIIAVQEKAKEIIIEKEQIISSQKDGEIFFEAITNPKQPSQTLKNAHQNYLNFITKSEKE